MTITLDNLEQFKVPLENSIYKWKFTDENDQLASKEHQDQICILTKPAANFLWDYLINLDIRCTSKYFKNITKFNSEYADQQAIKKYLYKLGIPFRQKAFVPDQPDTAFVLTWKMVIKYSHWLFRDDQIVWDKAFNWKLTFHHDGEFVFGKDLIFDGQLEMQKNRENLEIALKEMKERKNRNSFD